jgi:glutamine amidotransferase
VCRLLGYAAPEATTAGALLGSEQLDRFAQLSRVHNDGWGTSWLTEADEEPSRYRSPLAARDDVDAFAAHTGAIASTARVVHLRWATAGFDVDLRNSHPFCRKGLSFAHNGSIRPAGRINGLLGPDALANLDGSTDSERYFALILQELAADPGDVAGAVRRAVYGLRREFPSSSLNALVLTERELIVVHANAKARGPVGSLRAMGDKAPPDHLHAYFEMRWRRLAGGAVVVASSGLDPSGWQTVPAESVLRVDLRSLQMSACGLGSTTWRTLEEGAGLRAQP